MKIIKHPMYPVGCYAVDSDEELEILGTWMDANGIEYRRLTRYSRLMFKVVNHEEWFIMKWAGEGLV